MKIEKCPFCGCKAILCSTGNQFATEKFFVSCGVCGVETPRIARTRKEAIAAWNRRAGKDTNVATNADRIRSMSDEELAVWLVDANMCERVCAEEDYCGCDVCVKRVIDWLERPVKEE